MSSYVYKIVNILNGKLYFGKSNDPIARWKSYSTEFDFESNRMLIRKAIKKHGIENFEFTVIAKFSTENEAFDYERLMIRTHRSNDQSVGYNLNEGGKGGINPNSETRDLIGKTHRGKKFSFDRRQKMSKIKQADLDKIIDLLDAEKSLVEIAAIFSCTTSCVSSFLNRNGLDKEMRITRWPKSQKWILKKEECFVDKSLSKLTSSRMIEPQDKDVIRSLYVNECMTARQIAEKLDISHASIRSEISRMWRRFSISERGELRKRRNGKMRKAELSPVRVISATPADEDP